MCKKKLTRFFLALLGIALGVILVSSICHAVPQQITYQGQLTDQYGDPVPDGDYDMAFALYDVPTGGTALWDEEQAVTVTDGIYNVILGQLGNELDPTDFDGDLYLGVTIGTDAEMTPRQPVTSVGYTLRAAVADSLAEGAVTEIMIEDNAVTTAKVADQAITESKLGDATVTTVKIQDGATLSEISDDDGAGSGLDADLLDGLNASDFASAIHDHDSRYLNVTGDTMSGSSSNWVLFVSNSGTGTAVYGSSTNSSSGRGLAGEAVGTSGQGVYGYASGDTGYGVWGYADGTQGEGVHGKATGTEGVGVFGEATAYNGTTYGIYGISTYGYGVYGTAPYYAVYGEATAASGLAYGVYGRSASTSGSGVYGKASRYGVRGYASASTGTTYGVYGVSDSTLGSGVWGLAYATSGTTSGVVGRSESTEGCGVYGYAAALSGTNYGVYGKSNSTSGYNFYAGGAGTDYGPFTGAHEVKLADNFPQEVEPGLIVAATGQAQIRQNTDGSVNLSSTLPTVKLADTPHDKAVFGVLVAETTLPEDHWYEAQEGERFASVNALGEGRVWVADSNGKIEAGDYITTCSIPGYGQRQDDDLLHSYTLGKAIETVDWDTVTDTVEFNGKTYKVYLIAVIYTSG